jgi:dienelactone hydrolase
MLPREVPDSEAVLAFLLSKSGVDRSRIAAGGASCGVSAAVALARKRSEIRALVLVAGFARPDGLDFLAATPRLAVYGVAARQDATAPFDITAAVTASKHPRSTQTLYDGWEHAAALFARDPGLTPAVARWLMDVLQP